MKSELQGRITIIGTGLMGGSLGQAIKQFAPDMTIAGVDFPPVLAKAKKRNAIDQGFTPDQLKQAIKNGRYIFIATPIDTIIEILPEIAALADDGAIISDLGSTKCAICATAKRHIREGIHFIGGHPMTGSEFQGIDYADPYLFQNALYILTPFEEDHHTNELSKFLGHLGASVIYIEPELHDRIIAYTSHLPQLLAVGLTNLVGRKHFLHLAAGGFRDLTRIASSPFIIWKDILKTNEDRTKDVIDEFIQELHNLRSQIGKEVLNDDFDQAAQFRAEVPKNSKGFIETFPRISVRVPDQPGSLAKITSVLADDEINIKDIELLKVREYVGGTFHIHLETRDDARKATELLNKVGFKSREVD